MLKSIFGRISPSAFRQKAKEASREINEYEKKLMALCALSPEESLKQLGVDEKGLSSSDVEARQQEYGSNDLGPKEKMGFFMEIFQRCRNPLVIQLLVICIVFGATGDAFDASFVGGMIFLSVFLGYIQEHRSNNAVEALRNLVQTNSILIRGGKEEEVPMAQIVPGDIVVLHAGAIIPADLRLLTSKDFFVGQSSLTGESMPVEKHAEIGDTGGRGLIELQNACFQGSTVLSGTARGVIVNTGARTHFGSISEKLAGARVQTNFDKGISGFTWLMVRFMIVMVCIVFLIQGLTKGDWAQALLFALSVAVGLTPEMLPMIVTVNLSKGAIAMSRKKVIVKRLNSIQNFGAIDVLCTDKTGTLTQDNIILEKHVDVTNRESEDVLRYAWMNSYYQTGLRNLLDRSILTRADLDVETNCKKVDEIPFDFQRKRMSVVVDYEGDHVLICKGAVEDIYKSCSHYQVDEEINPLIDVIKNDLFEEYEAFSADGYRVLAIAYREFPRDKQVFSIADESDLVLLGYIAFFDPPKDSAARAIVSLREAGVRTKVLTGDNALVTRKVCRDVGLDADEIITGPQLQGLTQEQLGDLAEKHDLFARLSPTQKEDIIVALQKRGHVVGFMGDGINDALSMRAADVGISVDTAVDVAKESADIILLEKSLLVLEDGIMEGRKVFCNIVKYIRMGASSNFGNMFSMVGSSFLLPFLPMTPAQILLNNLLYDFSQVGIPFDNVDPEYLQAPRKWNIDNIKKFMFFIGPISSIFDYSTFFLMLYFFHCIEWTNKGTPTDQHYEKLFQSAWFVESILTQTMIVHIIRTRKIPFIQSAPSATLLICTVVIMAIGAYLPFSFLAERFGLIPLPAIFWAWVVGFVLCYSTLTHFVKVWFFKRYGID